MSDYFDPFDADRPLRLGCTCGAHASDAEHATATLRERSESADFIAYSNEFIEASMVLGSMPSFASFASVSRISLSTAGPASSAIPLRPTVNIGWRKSSARS